MIKIMQGEFYRVCKSRLFWLSVSISTFFAFALALTFHYNTVKLPPRSGMSVVASLNQFTEFNELKLHKQNTDVNSILRDVLATYFSEFEKKDIIPSIDIPNVPVVIWADKDALSRVFSNIIYNALIHGDGEYKISASTDENRCKIIISNRSATICQEDVPRLFDRFFTTDQSRNKKTTGLGLAIARRLTMQMGGEIQAQLQNQIFEIHISFTIHSTSLP